jgi:hypothetical protein
MANRQALGDREQPFPDQPIDALDLVVGGKRDQLGAGRAYLDPDHHSAAADTVGECAHVRG